tara:strand:- start:11263 stop:12312 length:1050 start_codon:yes stop_codon:yes gene_type:complete
MSIERIDYPIQKGDFFGPLAPEEYSESWPQYVLHLEDCYLGEKGTIYDSDFNLILEANFNYLFWHDRAAKGWGGPKNPIPPYNPCDALAPEFAKKAHFKEVIELDDSFSYVYGHHYFNIYVFGHFWDTLQDLQKIESLHLKNTKLITPPLSTHVTDVDFHLSLFGYPEKDRLSLSFPLGGQTLYKVPSLYYPSPTASPSQISINGLKYLRSKYNALLNESDNTTKLYLSRPEKVAGISQRRVLNNAEVINYLRSQGFTVVEGNEGIEKHINLFNKASIIIGAHGSLFRNIIFSDYNPKVFEFCPKNRACLNFTKIGKTLGLEYKWIETKADEDFNIKIDLNFLKDILNE